MEHDGVSSEEYSNWDSETSSGSLDDYSWPRRLYYDSSPNLTSCTEAILQDNVENLRALLTGSSLVNVPDNQGNTLLHLAVVIEKRKVFDYLLTVDDICLDVKNLDHLTPLMYAVRKVEEYYGLELIKRGADVNVRDDEGRTPVHVASQLDKERVIEALVNSGALINCEDHYGNLPLQLACRNNSFVIPLLLFYGAETTKVSWDETALDICLYHCRPETQEIVYNYTFDQWSSAVSLRTLIIAMVYNQQLFYKLIKNNQVVSDSTSVDFNLLNFYLYRVRPEMFQEFMKQCPTFVRDFFKRYNPLESSGRIRLKFFCMLCKSPCIESICRQQRKMGFSVKRIVRKSEQIAIEFLCCLLSYGFTISSEDLFEIFWMYGYGELFSILLHMDVKSNISYEQIFRRKPYFVLPALIHDFRLSTDILYKFARKPSRFFGPMGKLFAYRPVTTNGKRKSKTRLHRRRKREVITPTPTLSVPSLLELSREACRRYLIKTFDIRTRVKFFTMLQALPIAQGYKDILSYKQQIY